MRYNPAFRAYSETVKTLLGKIAILTFLVSPCTTWAAEKPRVEVWLINTRCAPVCGDWEKGKQQIRVWRLGENQQWDAAEIAALTGSGEKNTPTLFLLHGNRVTNDEAVEFAWPIYRWLYTQAGKQSFRVVIWSWPSARTHKRNRPDVQTKADYCDSQSYYLADCLRNMKSPAPISLIGFSFGARIITGGLHLLGGGTLSGQHLSESSPVLSEKNKKSEQSIRAVLVAAALDCFALAPGQSNANAPTQVEEMLVTRNGCDRALRFYSRLYGRGGPEALGYFGPCCGNAEKIRLLDVTCAVGKTHEWENYIYCSGLFNVLPHYVFLEEK
jgi:hypothetical protein